MPQYSEFLGIFFVLQAVWCCQAFAPSYGQHRYKESVKTANAFVVNHRQGQRRSSEIHAEDKTTATSFNKVSTGDESSVNGASGGLAAIGSTLQSQLASAFSALNESDQYDAVLTGLCAKILDSSKEGDEVSVALQDPIKLLEEMNARRVRASSRSLMALIDATVTTQDAKLMSQVLSLCIQNGGVTKYGNFQADITPLPTTRDSKVLCPDGKKKTRRERLDDLPDVPTDNRGTEIASALAVASVVGFCGTVDVLSIDEISGFTNFIWFSLVSVGLLDNFYDLLKFSLRTFAKDKVGDIPDELPLSIGSGKVSGTVIKGFNRLIQVDTERECECEAAALFAAYALGLPCFSFRPNALEAAVLVAESSQQDSDLDPLLTNNGIMKMLVWLMAPVAMESLKHPQLIQSDPREAGGFLSRLENSDLIDKNSLWWLFAESEERADMLKWAYTEADLMIRRNQPLVSEISQRLTGGSATIGDCVAAVEEW